MPTRFTLTIPIKPKVKGRPRAGKHGFYTDKSTREYEAAVESAYIASGGPRFVGEVQVTATFHKDHIDVTIIEATETSNLRGDLDNYVKALLDGLNGAAFLDDSQVVNIKAFKR